MPEVPWATDQAYLEINRPALHVMRRLKQEGRLSTRELTFFADQKPVEELYDLGKDPEELNNLAKNPEYAPVLRTMRAHEAQWQMENHDLGLADLGRRKPEKWLAAERARAGIKKNEPELWKRLEAGELMETQTWMKKYKSLKK
jgi:arylsulfatase A-like enzyme